MGVRPPYGKGGGSSASTPFSASLKSLALTALTFCQVHLLFAWNVYTPLDDYMSADAGVGLADFKAQVAASVVGGTVAFVLVTQALLEIADEPLVEVVTVANPSPEKVIELFELQAASDGTITSLTCPCANPSAPLSAVSAWTTEPDAFCDGVLGALRLQNGGQPAPAGNFNDLFTLLNDNANFQCIGAPAPAPPTPAWTAFVAQVTSLIGGRLFPGDPPGLIDAFAARLQVALCGQAFGMVSAGEFNPLPVPPLSTLLQNECAVPGANDETPDFFPFTLGNVALTDIANVVPLQQTRGRAFFSAAADTCAAVFRLQQAFLSSVGGERLVAPIALAPTALGNDVEALWFLELAQRGGEAATLVPGVAPSYTDGLSDALETRLALLGLDSARALRTRPNLPIESFTFSSRVPFVRADSIIGGNTAFYVTTTVPAPSTVAPTRLNLREPVVLFAGKARTRYFCCWFFSVPACHFGDARLRRHSDKRPRAPR